MNEDAPRKWGIFHLEPTHLDGKIESFKCFRKEEIVRLEVAKAPRQTLEDPCARIDYGFVLSRQVNLRCRFRRLPESSGVGLKETITCGIPV